MATLRRRNLRSPGQTSGWKEHPSDTGSKSYYANTGRGWVPKNQSNLNTAAINARRNTREPGITGRPSWRTFDYTPSQGYDRSGPARGNLQDYGRNYRNIELANRRGLGSLAEDKGMGLLGHLNQWLGRDEDAEGFSMGDLPLPKVMKMAGDTISDAARGSRLMNKYQDLAVQEGRSKASGFKDWENDKKSMMTAKDRAFYDKYMNLADMAQDSTKAQEYRDTAETAWRNKQTSDRLSAITQFEGYNPSKYTGEGEGSRYTGSHREAPDRVPGYDRIREVWGNLNMGGGSPQYYETGEHWTDTSGEVAEIGPDYEIGEHWNIDDTPFGLTETEDITTDIGGGLDALNLMPNDLDEQRQKTIFQNRFTGQKHDPYRKEALTTYPQDISAFDYTDNFAPLSTFEGMQSGDTRNIPTHRLGTRKGPGDISQFYMNRIGDIINRGSVTDPAFTTINEEDDEIRRISNHPIYKNR